LDSSFIEEIEKLANDNVPPRHWAWPVSAKLAQQLLDTMRENERLRSEIAELEFNFPVHEFQTRQLMELSTPDTPFHLQKGKSWQGLMNGKIDFIGKQGEKFYLIDWKSNHLGYEAASYNEPALQEAMDANNYHLQYYIYLVALYKYLQSRISDFEYDRHVGGVFYLFVRGIRSGASQGIFYRKPSHEQLLRFMNILSI
jgi:exodeoxyribonuclease V beta subunit